MDINEKLQRYLYPVTILKASIAQRITDEMYGDAEGIKILKVSPEIKKYIEETGIVIDVNMSVRIYEFGGTFVQLITD